MSPVNLTSTHRDVWLLLPWMANGRLSNSQREYVQEHVRVCSKCEQELSVQRRICESLETPDRVTYAPGPSFRKLLERIDEAEPRGRKSAHEPAQQGEAMRPAAFGNKAALWRPPGLAWAASFIIMVGLTALISTASRWTEPRYATRTDAADASRPGVLHIAFQRDLTIGEVEELLRANGARVVEGPGSTGIFGVATLSAVPRGAVANEEMLKLASRLRGDPRVRWVEPVEPTRPSTGQGP